MAKGKIPKANSKTKAGVKRQTAPLAVSITLMKRKPTFQPVSGSDGRIRVTHTEWVRTLTVQSSEFSMLVDVPLNPGLPNVFPWLSNIANNYDSYTMEKCIIHYVPNCPATSLGQVMMMVDYDPLDDPPQDISTFMNSHAATSSSTWAPCKVVCDKLDMQKWPIRFTRKGIHTVSDGKTYDFGRLFVASSAGQVTANAGNIYIEYTVVLQTPQLRNLGVEECKFYSNNVGTGSGTVLGTVANAIATGGLDVVQTDAKTLMFRTVGDYLLNLTAAGTVFTGAAATVSSTPFASIKEIGRMKNATLAADATQAIYNFAVNVRQPDSTISLDTIPSTTVSASNIRVAPWAYGIQA